MGGLAVGETPKCRHGCGIRVQGLATAGCVQGDSYLVEADDYNDYLVEADDDNVCATEAENTTSFPGFVKTTLR